MPSTTSTPTTTPTAPSIPHSAACRRPAPTLRRSWRGEPEAHCPGCGRAVILPTPTEENH